MPVEIIGAPPPQQPAAKFRCPQCKAENPPYGFVLNGGDLGLVGTVQYFTIFCGAAISPEASVAGDTPSEPRICGCILGVQIINYQPPRDPAQLLALQTALRGGKPQ
jgi:hypothetical protein